MTQSLFSDFAPHAAGAAAPGWFVAHCDGGSRGNPGPAGYGAVIEDPEGRVVARLSDYLGKQTNNFAEYSGLLAVLRWALENGARRLKVVSDSELMVKQMKGAYKVASPGLRPLWEQAKSLARQLDAFQMTHTLRGGNQEADRLANEAMDRGMGRKPAAISGANAVSSSGASATSKPAGLTGAARPSPRPTRQVFEGLVKNGVVHLIEGELPDGILVKVIWE